MEILEQLPPSTPYWILSLLVALNIFKAPIASFLFERFPKMANSHFSALAERKMKYANFAQDKEMALLKNQLEDSEVQRKALFQREKTRDDLLKDLVEFIEKTVVDLMNVNSEKRDVSDANILRELEEIKKGIEQVARATERWARKSGVQSTQEILLDRIEGGDK